MYYNEIQHTRLSVTSSDSLVIIKSKAYDAGSLKKKELFKLIQAWIILSQIMKELFKEEAWRLMPNHSDSLDIGLKAKRRRYILNANSTPNF